MPSPEDPKEAIWGSEVKPSVPSMPPPQPPKSKADDEHFEEVYEDIDIGFNPAYRDATSPAPNHQHSLKTVPYSPKYQKRSQQRRIISFMSNDRESIYHAYASDQGEDDHGGMAQSFNNSWGESNNLTSQISATDKRRSLHHFGTWGAGKSRRSNKSSAKLLRPPSGGALELEKILRIKSEIQLNISKKVDKIKSKVSHSPALTKSMRASSGNNLVFVDPKILQTDSNPSPSTSQRQKQEAYLYGDNWSTDDDEDDDDIDEQEAYLYGDNWSTDDDEDDDIDEVYGHGKVPPPPTSSGSPSIIYSSTSNNSASTNNSNNFPIEKSKSAGNALNFWKSIDSALTIGRRAGKEASSSRPSCLPIQTTSTFNGE
uniref:Uncharacterized protein n=1 Tax=Panagrolaimus sp. ES5 TaxID=591445 RepID=A0AC34FNF1_9BILA